MSLTASCTVLEISFSLGNVHDLFYLILQQSLFLPRAGFLWHFDGILWSQHNIQFFCFVFATLKENKLFCCILFYCLLYVTNVQIYSFILGPTSPASFDDSGSMKSNKSTCLVYKDIMHLILIWVTILTIKLLPDINLEKTKTQIFMKNSFFLRKKKNRVKNFE